jgi:hypothetical protein
MQLQFPSYHYRLNTIPCDSSIDIGFLGQLLSSEIPSLVESCCAVEGTLKKALKCSRSCVL